MTSMGLDRRQLLQGAAALATVWAGAATFATDYPFAMGVASGSPTADGVVLWTRVLPPVSSADVPVRWELAHDAQFKHLVQSGIALAQATWGHSVHVELQGLESARWYHYRFMVGDAISTVGRTRTLPAPDAAVSNLRLAYASCQRWEHGYFAAYRHMLAEQLDAVVFLGDYIYEYPGAADPVRKVRGGWVQTLEDYRARYALYKSDPDLQAMHAACPWLLTWDDHEVQNDYAGSTAGDSGPPVADFAQRRAAAYQAYYENMPLSARSLTQGLAGLARGAELRLYASVPFGKLATVYLLDDRQYRDPQACTKGARPGSGLVDPAQCPAWNDPRRTLLGVQQERWLDAALASSAGVQWNVLAQQTLLGQRDFRFGEAKSFSNDGWDGYAPARARLLASLQRHAVANPVVLGGDLHANWVGHVLADYTRSDSAHLGVELCGTSISARGGSAGRLEERLQRNPHFVYADAQQHGYGVVEFTLKQLSAYLRGVDDVRRADTGIRTLAHFVVESGSAQLQRIG